MWKFFVHLPDVRLESHKSGQLFDFGIALAQLRFFRLLKATRAGPGHNDGGSRDAEIVRALTGGSPLGQL